jgi:arabinoxylan arabinofuranohydrolase
MRHSTPTLGDRAMSYNIFKIVFYLLMVSLFIHPCFADNPIIQTCFTADPAPLVYENTVYVYVGHDSASAPNDGYLMRAWKCYSSNDMVNWTDHGVVLPTSVFGWSGGEADAAQVVYRNGTFYYYISTNASGGVALGVAVSKNPTGPFKDTLGKPLIAASLMTGCNATHSWRGLDPTVFIDDDGQAYLYWGNNVCYWVRLNSNMISYTGSITCIAQTDAAAFGPDFEEAPWLYKRNSLYYLIYASEFPESIRYATSPSPTGPWTYKGQIMAKQPNGVSNTIHPGVCDFGGNSYFFYHNAGLANGGSYRRSVCVEQFSYNADGTIPAIPETKTGVKTGVGNLNPYDTIQAETICWASGVKTRMCSEGGIQIDSIHNGDYIKVKGVDFGSGAKSFEARVASSTSGGNIELRLDSQTGTLVGTCVTSGTGGSQTWVTKTCTVSGASGIQDLFLKFTGSSDLLFNFNWWRFIPVESGLESTVWSHNVCDELISFITDFYGRRSIVIHDIARKPLGEVQIALFDATGRRLDVLFRGKLPPGRQVLPVCQTIKSPGVCLVRISSYNVVLFTKVLVR